MPAPKGNKNAVGNNGGREPFYTDPNVMQAKVDEYFETGDKKMIYDQFGIPHEIRVITVTGLALYLGFNTRKSLLDYAGKVEFVNVIKKAVSRVELMYESNLQTGQPTGSIFALKNMGWRDKQELDHSGLPPATINVTVDKSETAETLKKLRSGNG
jgi:hypothetical protein